MATAHDTTPDPREPGLVARLHRELGLAAGRSDSSCHPAVPLSSSLAVGELAWASVLVAGATLSATSAAPPDPARIAAAFRSDRHLRIDGATPQSWAPLSRFWRTADGWIRTHGNYPHHAHALLDGLRLDRDADPGSVEAALSGMRAADAVDAITVAGGIGVSVRKERDAVDAELRRRPLVDLTRLAVSSSRALPHGGSPLALTGVRVLDLTRVIAGPVATRTLALAGADVLRIDPPDRAEPAWQHLDTGHGKRSALLDVSADRARFDALLADADVLVLGYRPQGLRRLGLTASALASRHPHLVIGQLSAWPGDDSPRGFDSIVQAECGISWLESADGVVPGALPAQALDHSAGYLLAAGIVTALRRRAESGGAWHVRTSLRRMAAELLGLPRSSPGAAPAPLDEQAQTQTFAVAGRTVTTVVPAVRWPGSPELFASPRPWGTDPPEW
ncbi:CoA transferase [Microbacterium sp. NPDC058342]|uniref:CoA transferase n=1 Tax=Microbacterium sp. NPDC058342 TaxID=3346454 RepID=UPI003663F8AD